MTLPHLAALSNDDAVERLYELTAAGDDGAELAQLDAVVYERLLRAYESEQTPRLRNLLDGT